MNKQNKLTPKLIFIIVIIALVIVVVLFRVLAYINYIDRAKNVDKGKEVLEEEADSLSQGSNEFEVFMNGLRKIMETDCNREKMHETKYVGEYKGFSWINGSKEAELIKGYDIFPTVKGLLFMGDGCRNNIITYLGETLVPNARNTNNKVLGFEKNNMRCLFYTGCSDLLCLQCGDASKNVTPEFYNGIYRCLNPKMDPSFVFGIVEIEGNFAIAGTIDYAILLEKIENEWVKLDENQDSWECEIVFEHEVPPSLIGNTCMFYKTTREVWHYNEESDKWEKWYHIDSPWDRE
jgi:hypothetical protein